MKPNPELTAAVAAVVVTVVDAVVVVVVTAAAVAAAVIAITIVTSVSPAGNTFEPRITQTIPAFPCNPWLNYFLASGVIFRVSFSLPRFTSITYS